MAFVSSSRRTGFSFGTTQLTSLATHFSQFVERAMLSYRQQKTFNALKALDTCQLADIGLTSSDVREMAEVSHDRAIWNLNLARKRASVL